MQFITVFSVAEIRKYYFYRMVARYFCEGVYFFLFESAFPQFSLYLFRIYICCFMQDFHSLLLNRRSHRKFSEEKLSPDEVRLILEAALLSPTSKNRHSWEFVVVEAGETLHKLSSCKPHGCRFIENAALAVAVLGNPLVSDTWIEDASIAALAMQLQAESLGIGSCWVQVRGRLFSETIASGEYLNELLDVPAPLDVLCILAFGKKAEDKKPAEEASLLWEKVHIEKYRFPETGN